MFVFEFAYLSLSPTNKLFTITLFGLKAQRLLGVFAGLKLIVFKVENIESKIRSQHSPLQFQILRSIGQHEVLATWNSSKYWVLVPSKKCIAANLQRQATPAIRRHQAPNFEVNPLKPEDTRRRLNISFS